MANSNKHQEITNQIIRDWSQTETSRDNGSMALIFARRAQWDEDLDLNVDTEDGGQLYLAQPEPGRALGELPNHQ